MDDKQWHLGFKEIRLKSGEVIPVENGLTVVVGPNNSGKSQLLMELLELSHLQLDQGAEEARSRRKVVQSASSSNEGSFESFLGWLNANGVALTQFWTIQRESREVRMMPDIAHSDYHLRQIEDEAWKHHKYQLAVNHHLVTYLDIENRLRHMDSVDSLDPSSQTSRPYHALQHLYEDESKERMLREKVRSAFGNGVEVWRDAGPRIHLVTGKPQYDFKIQRQLYKQDMQSRPKAYEEGHGFRSYTGILMEIIVGDRPVILIDEPEAFLHPPQARKLGRELAEFQKSGKQIIIATHSTDLLQGIIGSRSQPSVTIVRITRTGTKNHVTTIDQEIVRKITHDPLLRHSSILDGLFYDGVVLTEGDGDAIYYSIVYDTITSDGDRLDVLFTHANGGYMRYGTAVKALRSLRVPCVSIIDVDVLAGEREAVFSGIIEAHGSTIDELGISGDLAMIRDAVMKKATSPTRKDVLELFETFRKVNDRHMHGEEVSQLKKVVKGKTGWQVAKSESEAGLTGELLERYRSVVDQLNQIGIFVVPVGEREGFHREAQPNPKAAWTADVLERELYLVNGPHKTFVADIKDSIIKQRTQGSFGAEAGIEPEA